MRNDDTIVISRDALSALIIIAGKLFQPSPSFFALHFLDSIEEGSNADKVALKQNDYVLE
ncbi:unnamed protein product, partial [Rotaria sp. Silwood2]